MAESSDVRLRRMIEAIELIDTEIADMQAERRERMAEFKAVGYHLGTVRQVLARRKLSPAERGEADALLEAYEAALGGEAAAVPLRSSNADLAAALLAEQLDGMEDQARAELVVEHVLALLDIRAEIAVLRLQERDRRKLADDEGFEAKQLALVVRWYEKCAKHGPEEMKAGEQVFRLYRATVDEAGGPVRPDGAPPTADEKLAALFAKPAPKAPTAKQRAVSDAVAMAKFYGKGRG
jgi:uncharacterized protein (UPF0335 family)